MTRSLSLAVLLAAGLALPAVAEETPAQSAPAEAKSVAAPQPFRMVRTLGGDKSCKRFRLSRRIVWRPMPQSQTQQ